MRHIVGLGTWGMGTWAIGYMVNGPHEQRGILVNTADRDGKHWGMGHMGDGAHGKWNTRAIGHMGISSLILHESSPKLNST